MKRSRVRRAKRNSPTEREVRFANSNIFFISLANALVATLEITTKSARQGCKINISSINANWTVMRYDEDLKSLNHVDRFRDVSEPFANGGFQERLHLHG